MSPRKRKRDQFISQEEEEAELNEAEAEALTEEQKAQKQQEIWDAFREAHYEALEQLPLTLHRQLSLMRQLDEQAHNYGAHVLPTLLKYIQKRQAISQGQTQAHDDDNSLPPAGNPAPQHANSVQSPTYGDVKLAPILARSSSKQGSLASSRNSPPMGMPPNRLHPPENMRDLLAHVAWLSDEIIHVSQEKVNLALSAHDSVERHIRLLDQAIKEQEISLSNGSSHPVIHLPDLAVPRWTRAMRTTLSPLEDSAGNLGGYRGGAPFADPVVLDNSSHRSLKKKGRHSHRAPDGRFEDHSDASKDPTPLTITLPATHASEELYCYCNRVSFGEMIACDGENCEREWFHLGCVGLLHPPEGDWYCEDCRGEDT